MTTEHRSPSALRGAGALVGAAAVTLVLVVLVAVAGGLVSGTPAATGALVGGVVVLAVWCLGLFSVHVVSHVMPGAALMFALFTYGLQLAVMTLALVALTGSDLSFDDGWFVAGVIVAVGGWVVTQLALSTRARIPAYDVDLPVASTPREAGAR